jgi:lysophospholipase L1-like esterase
VNFRVLLFILVTLSAAAICQAELPAKPLFELSEGENRIVFVGGGFIEQARLSGYIEVQLMRTWPADRAVIFRNLGWSGDSVSGAARTAGFEQPAGLDRLLKDLDLLKPTVIIVGYGFVESFDGEAGVAKFSEEYKTLLDALAKRTPKLVLLSTTIQEGRPGDDVSGRNRDLERYSAAITNIATERKLPFVDLYHPLVEFKRTHPEARLTSNGITLSEFGYETVAKVIAQQLGLSCEATRGEISAEAEKLRRAIVRSNELFYRRSRPYNDHSRHWTYIGGDYAMYDKQLAEMDKVVVELRGPVSRECESAGNGNTKR